MVCRKCGRKLGGGFGPKGKTSLAKLLRRAYRTQKKRRGPLGVVDVACFGICSRNAVVLMRGSTPQRLTLVPAGADARTIARDVGLPPPDADETS